VTALPDGMTVRVDSTAAYAPVTPVYCGTSAAVEGPSPVIVVEVAPSTRHVDLSAKRADYFQPASGMT
jgi:Uma2 family endonuclease